MTSSGRLFQTLAPAIGKARLPTYIYRLVEGSRPKGMASHRGHSNAPAGVGYEEEEDN